MILDISLQVSSVHALPLIANALSIMSSKNSSISMENDLKPSPKVVLKSKSGQKQQTRNTLKKNRQQNSVKSLEPVTVPTLVKVEDENQPAETDEKQNASMIKPSLKSPKPTSMDIAREAIRHSIIASGRTIAPAINLQTPEKMSSGHFIATQAPTSLKNDKKEIKEAGDNEENLVFSKESRNIDENDFTAVDLVGEEVSNIMQLPAAKENLALMDVVRSNVLEGLETKQEAIKENNIKSITMTNANTMSAMDIARDVIREAILAEKEEESNISRGVNMSINNTQIAESVIPSSEDSINESSQQKPSDVVITKIKTTVKPSQDVVTTVKETRQGNLSRKSTTPKTKKSRRVFSNFKPPSKSRNPLLRKQLRPKFGNRIRDLQKSSTRNISNFDGKPKNRERVRVRTFLPRPVPNSIQSRPGRKFIPNNQRPKIISRLKDPEKGFSIDDKQILPINDSPAFSIRFLKPDTMKQDPVSPNKTINEQIFGSRDKNAKLSVTQNDTSIAEFPTVPTTTIGSNSNGTMADNLSENQTTVSEEKEFMKDSKLMEVADFKPRQSPALENQFTIGVDTQSVNDRQNGNSEIQSKPVNLEDLEPVIKDKNSPLLLDSTDNLNLALVSQDPSEESLADTDSFPTLNAPAIMKPLKTSLKPLNAGIEISDIVVSDINANDMLPSSVLPKESIPIGDLAGSQFQQDAMLKQIQGDLTLENQRPLLPVLIEPSSDMSSLFTEEQNMRNLNQDKNGEIGTNNGNPFLAPQPVIIDESLGNDDTDMSLSTFPIQELEKEEVLKDRNVKSEIIKLNQDKVPQSPQGKPKGKLRGNPLVQILKFNRREKKLNGRDAKVDMSQMPVFRELVDVPKNFKSDFDQLPPKMKNNLGKILKQNNVEMLVMDNLMNAEADDVETTQTVMLSTNKSLNKNKMNNNKRRKKPTAQKFEIKPTMRRPEVVTFSKVNANLIETANESKQGNMLC